jgi:hypothetical protein
MRPIPWELALESMLRMLQGTQLGWWPVGCAAH